MSFIYRDGTYLPRAKLEMYGATYQNFKKYWGTNIETIDGIEVYGGKKVFYRGGSFVQDKVTKKFVKSIGMVWEDFIAQEVDDEIESMWFELKSNYAWDGTYANSDIVERVSYSYTAPTREQIVAYLNEIEVGTEVSVTVSYGGALKNYVSAHSLEWEASGSEILVSPFNSDVVRDTLHSNPWYYFVNSRHLAYVEDSYPYKVYNGSSTSSVSIDYTLNGSKLPTCDVASNEKYGIFALLGDNTSFEIVEDTIDSIISTVADKNGEVLRYDYTLKYTYKGVNVNSPVVAQMEGWFDNYYKSIANIPYKKNSGNGYRDMVITSTLDTRFKRLMDAMTTFEVTEEGLTGEGTGGLYYGGKLRVDRAAKMKRRDFCTMLGECIDTDYEVEDASWWEQVLAVVIVIIAIVITYLTWGAAGGAAGGLVSISTAAGAGALTLSIGSAILSAVGGLSAGGLVKIIGSFAQVVGLVATVLGIYAMITSAIRSATTEVAKKALAQKGLEATATNLAVEEAKVTAIDIVNEIVSSAIDKVVDKVISVFTGEAFSSASQVVSATTDTLKVAVKAMEVYNDKEAEELQKSYDELSELEDKYNEEVLNKSVFEGSSIYAIIHEKLSTPDMLQDLAVDIDSKVGGDKNYWTWNTNVNT